MVYRRLKSRFAKLIYLQDAKTWSLKEIRSWPKKTIRHRAGNCRGSILIETRSWNWGMIYHYSHAGKTLCIYRNHWKRFFYGRCLDRYKFGKGPFLGVTAPLDLKHNPSAKGNAQRGGDHQLALRADLVGVCSIILGRGHYVGTFGPQPF